MRKKKQHYKPIFKIPNSHLTKQYAKAYQYTTAPKYDFLSKTLTRQHELDYIIQTPQGSLLNGKLNPKGGK